MRGDAEASLGGFWVVDVAYDPYWARRLRWVLATVPAAGLCVALCGDGERVPGWPRVDGRAMPASVALERMGPGGGTWAAWLDLEPDLIERAARSPLADAVPQWLDPAGDPGARWLRSTPPAPATLEAVAEGRASAAEWRAFAGTAAERAVHRRLRERAWRYVRRRGRGRAPSRDALWLWAERARSPRDLGFDAPVHAGTEAQVEVAIRRATRPRALGRESGGVDAAAAAWMLGDTLVARWVLERAMATEAPVASLERAFELSFLSTLLDELGSLQAARAARQEAASLVWELWDGGEPPEAAVELNVARMFLHLRDYPRALQAFDYCSRAAETPREQALAFVGYTEILHRERRHGDALDVLDRFEQLLPSLEATDRDVFRAALERARARSSQALGPIELTWTGYRDTVQADREVVGGRHPQVLEDMLRREVLRGGPEGVAAIREVQEAMAMLGVSEQSREGTLLRIAEALILAETGHHETARVLLKRLLAEFDPGGDRLRLAELESVLGSVLDKLGRPSEAAVRYERALDLWSAEPDLPPALLPRVEAAADAWLRVLSKGPAPVKQPSPDEKVEVILGRLRAGSDP